MKICQGKEHGAVDKIINDDEKYCLLCKARKNAKKMENVKKAKEIVKTIGAVALFAGQVALTVLSKGKSSKT
jgi:hypothetical protein